MSKNKDLTLKVSDDINFDITTEFAKINKKFTNPTTLITSIWNQEIIDDFNDFIQKIISSISNSLVDKDKYSSLLAELNVNNNFTNNFLDKLDLNLLKCGIDDKTYYNILKLKYTDLGFFLQQFWSKILEKTNKLEKDKNIDKNCDCFNVDKYKNIDDNKEKYRKLLDILQNNIDDFRKQLEQFKEKNKKNPEKALEYQILRYIWLKNIKFRSKVLDDILKIERNDIKTLKYDKYEKIQNTLRNMYIWEDRAKEWLDIQKIEILEEILSKNINTNTYFDIEKITEWNSDYWKYIKNYIFKNFVEDEVYLITNNLSLQEYVKNAKIFDYGKFQNTLTEIKKAENPDNNLTQKLETLKLYEKLFIIKDIILKIEDKMWYSPWIKVFIKQWLAEKLDFSKEEIKRFKYILYFVLAQNYSEYKILKKFFDETENIYQKEKTWKKILNTISIFVLWAVFYWILYFYIDAEIYKTLFFIFVFISTFVLWYLRKFDLKFDNIQPSVKYISLLWWFFISLFAFLSTIWYFGFNIFAGIFLFLTLFFLYSFIASIWWKYFNSGVYKISLFLFLVMFVLWLWKSSNEGDIFIKKWKEITSVFVGTGVWEQLFNPKLRKDFGKDNFVKVLVYDRFLKNKSMATDVLNKNKTWK